MPTFRKSLFLTVFLSLVFASLAAAATTHDVDCLSGFPDVDSALAVAGIGDVIVVHPCTIFPFQYPAFTVLGRTNIQIVGADAPSFILSAFPIGANANPPNAPALIRSVNNTCATIDSSTNISLVGLLFEDCAGNGIEIRASRNIKIHGNALSFASASGVSVRGSRFVDITGNHLRGAADAGIQTDPGSTSVHIEANRVNDNQNGIWIEGQAIDVTNNEVHDNADQGILILSRDSKVSRNWVVGNGAAQINYTNWPLSFDNCVVGNWINGPLVPAASLFGCQAENL